MKLRILNKSLAKKLLYCAYTNPPNPKGGTIRISGIEVSDFDFVPGGGHLSHDQLIDLRDDIHDLINTAVGLKTK